MSYAYSGKLSAFAMPHRSRLSLDTRANAIHRDPTRAAHRAGATVIVLALAGCSLLVDTDVPARGSGSGAGSSHSAPNAGMATTIGASTWLGLAGNESGGTRVTGGGVNGAVNSTQATTIAAMGGGGASTNDSANLGGSRDSGTTGGASLGSGGTTASSGGVGGTSNVDCSAANLFCDGFEQGTIQEADAGESWSADGLGDIKNAGLGYVEAERPGFNSDKTLAIHYSGIPQGRVARLEKDLVNDLGLSPNGTVRIDFDFFYSGGDFYPFSLFCGGNGYQLSFNLDVNSVTEKGGNVADGVEKPYPTSKNISWKEDNTVFRSWQHLELLLNRGTATISMALGGVSILDPTKLTGYLSGPSCRFAIGVMYAGTTDSISFDAYFDNVRIQVN